jgi:hypothetical protein
MHEGNHITLCVPYGRAVLYIIVYVTYGHHKGDPAIRCHMLITYDIIQWHRPSEESKRRSATCGDELQ